MGIKPGSDEEDGREAEVEKVIHDNRTLPDEYAQRELMAGHEASKMR